MGYEMNNFQKDQLMNISSVIFTWIIVRWNIIKKSSPVGWPVLWRSPVKIEWDYNNPESQLENGQVCDRVGGRECDVYFTLCLKNAASVTSDIDKCHLLQHTTRIYDNAGYLEFRGGDAIEVSLPQPAPNEYTFTLGIFEQDIFGVVEIIGTLVAQQFTLLPTNEWTEIKMDRDNNHYQNKINDNPNDNVTETYRSVTVCV
ncbi:unnamed protein product [Heterobilharzia americana]|nr:unnamed protein product [Heterobilharzia americana]